MFLQAEDLPRDPDVLIGMVTAQAAEIDKLRTMLKTVQALVFGARSERRVCLMEGQASLDLGDLADDVGPMAANDEGDGAKAPRPARDRTRVRRNIGLLPKNLPRALAVIEPASLQCPCCEGALHKIGEDIAEALDVVPAVLRVLRTIRPRYACRACAGAVVQAPARARPFDGGMATTALIASVAVWKFAWHMPLNRQALMLAGQGVTLDRSTLCKWMRRLAWWLSGLYERQIEVMHSYPRLFCDETRMPVRRPDKKHCHIGQFWTHATDDRPWLGPAPPAVAYVYAEGRGHAEIKGQLAGYAGLVQADGYAGYNGLARPSRAAGDITLVYCLAHARRKFTDVYKATKDPFAGEAIDRIAAVYAIKARIRGTSADNRRRVRQDLTAPLMADLQAALISALAKVSSKSTLAKAIRYSLGRWAGLTLFLEDGRLEVDTNTVERSIRPVALGRRNSLFAGDDGGAETWAILASLLQTARLNGLDPYGWLHDVLEKIVSGEVKANHLDQLLAWNWKAAHQTEPPLAAAA